MTAMRRNELAEVNGQERHGRVGRMWGALEANRVAGPYQDDAKLRKTTGVFTLSVGSDPWIVASPACCAAVEAVDSHADPPTIECAWSVT